MSRFVPLLPALLALLPAAAGQGAVHVVDPFDPAAFADVQLAVNAAADGDTILVRSGGGSYFEVAGKSLVVVADAGFDPWFTNPFGPNNHGMDQMVAHTVVRDLAAGQRVVLRGLSFGGLQLDGNAGQVWVEDATVNFVSPALRATDCDSVVLQRLAVTGPTPSLDPYFWKVGGHALELAGSRAALHGVTAAGGQGLSFTCSIFGLCGNAGGYDGLVLDGGSAWLGNVVATGGHGGSGGTDQFGFCHAGGAGGHGLRAAGGAAAWLAGFAGAGGSGAAGPDPGTCIWGGGGDGADGAAVTASGATATTLAATPVDLLTDAPVREGETLQVTVQGAPGTPVLLLAAPFSGHVDIGAVDGPLLVGFPALLVALGPLPAGGSLTLSSPVPELGPGVEAAAVTLQALGGAPGGLLAGGASTLVLLDGGL